MPLDSSWWANGPTDPFRDNAIGAIGADTLRAFAEDVASVGIAADWFQATSGTLDLNQYEFNTTSVAETVWFRGNTGNTYTGSNEWTAGVENTTGRDEAHFTYNAPLLSLYVSFSPSTVAFTNVTVGTLIQPVIFIGSSYYVGDVADIGNGVRTASGDTSVNLTYSNMLLFDATTTPTIKVGVRLIPPSASTIANGSISIDLSDLKVLAVVRPAASPV